MKVCPWPVTPAGLKCSSVFRASNAYHSQDFKFNVFVANRVASIQELAANMEWHLVPTALNPADVSSRGTTPDHLVLS